MIFLSKKLELKYINIAKKSKTNFDATFIKNTNVGTPKQQLAISQSINMRMR